MDDNGSPLEGIRIEAATVTGWVPGMEFGKNHLHQVGAMTDANGVAAIRLPTGNGTIDYSIRRSSTVYGQRWQSPAAEGKTKTIVYCKSVRKPVSMYVKWFDDDPIFWNQKLPSKKSRCDFDLVRGEWLPPFGNGEHADLSFQWREETALESIIKPFEVSLEVSLPGRENGLIWAESLEPGESDMPLPRFAPPGGYQPNILLRMWKTESDGTKTNFYWVTEKRIGYFFRIRSELNEIGQIKAAKYGKLVGGIAFRPRSNGEVSLSFHYYLNPSDNDRNMENKLDANLFPSADPLGRRK